VGANSNHRYFVINKPYDMVSQFISPHKVRLLSNLDFTFPEHTHAIGRLDTNSEGLLLLTTNKKVTRLLFQSDVPHKRVYLVQVKNTLSEQKLILLQNGTIIRIENGIEYRTPPCEVSIVEDPEVFYPFVNNFVQRSPNSWLLITLTEGKYHQVRKMIASVHLRCKRLIRVSIEDLQLGDLPPGKVRECREDEFFSLLRLKG
jgi:23S rRNA pseudouridine2457 synthase